MANPRERPIPSCTTSKSYDTRNEWLFLLLFPWEQYNEKPASFQFARIRSSPQPPTFFRGLHVPNVRTPSQIDYIAQYQRSSAFFGSIASQHCSSRCSVSSGPAEAPHQSQSAQTASWTSRLLSIVLQPHRIRYRWSWDLGQLTFDCTPQAATNIRRSVRP